jgi:hypothetical protein
MADAGTFSVDTDGVAHAAPAVNELSGSLQDVYNTLTTALEAVGMMPGASSPAWGDDASGRAFAANYVSGAQTAYASLQTAAQSAGQVATGIQQLAGGLAGAEEAAAQAAR